MPAVQSAGTRAIPDGSAVMPRYFFHLIDGSDIRDEVGEQLPDLAAARRSALLILGEILNARSERFWQDGSVRVVVDCEGRTVIEVEARDMSPRPARLSVV